MNDVELRERVARELAGRYRVERELARGGMSRIYLARDERHDRPVVVKVLEPELAHSVAVARFEREIRLCAGLNHPNILPLLDSGRVAELPFYVTPYVAEASVKRRLQDEPQLPVDEALRITTEVAAALEHAHAAGIVHRDIKPENILLSSGHALVADFGIAQAIARAGGERLTESGAAVGTPTYMSPEQAAAEPTIDGRSDIYSLACVAYEMLTGNPPFTGRTTQAVMARHLADRPSAIRVVRPAVPEAVDLAIGRALAKVPADRFRSAGDFARALRETEVTRAPARRVRQALLGVGLAVLAVILVVWLYDGSPLAPLDPHAVVVFPLEGGDGATGEGVASVLGYVLDDTDPLRWIEGWHLLDARGRDAPRLVDLAEARSLAEGAGATHFVTGRIVRRGDSTDVILTLHATRPPRDGSFVERAGASGAADEPVTSLALSAVSDLLLPLLEPGRTVDPGMLADRRPAALANFYLGESEYRRGRFEEALGHYFRALEQDSTLALAALRGAETAIWLKRFREARAASELAAGQPDLLPAAYRPLARGIQSLLQGQVDTALADVRRHLEERRTSTAGWTLLGEGLLHHFPEVADADGEAEAAFLAALELDPNFVPATYHLVELAVMRGDGGTGSRWKGVAGSDLPPEIVTHVGLLLSCDTVPDRARRRAAMESAPRSSLLGVGFVLAVAAGTRGCAEDALALVVEDVSAGSSVRYAALQVLGSVLVGEGRSGEAHRRTRAATRWSDGAPYLHLLWDVAGGMTSDDATRQAARMWADGVEDRPVSLVWLLGVWEARHGEGLRADSLARQLALAADGSETERLLASALAAHAAAAAGRSADALEILETLHVGAPVDRLQWQFWNALYPERLLHADLLLRRGDREAALAVLERLTPTYPRTAVSAAFGPAASELRRSSDPS